MNKNRNFDFLRVHQIYVHQVKLGHRFSQIFTDIWFFVAFNILVIRVHPCPQNGNSYTFKLKRECKFIEILENMWF